MSQAVSVVSPAPVHNDDLIPDVYVDGPVGVNYFNGTLRITFATLRADHSTNPVLQYRKVTLRLVIPLPGAIDLQTHITNIVLRLHSQGAILPITPGPQTRQ
jgi:hypothetical protein